MSQTKEVQPGPEYQLPDKELLQSASKLSVLAKDGTAVPFGSLYSGKGRHMIVFIRHFYCGSCEDYVRTLSTQLPPSILDAQSPPVTLKFVGCGDPSLIEGYAARTSCAFPIFADPDRKLYKLFEMGEKMAPQGDKPEYIKTGLAQSTWNGFRRHFTDGIFKGGNHSQNGGELLFEDDELKFCHRMTHSMDHTEVYELKELLGIHDM